MYVRVSTLYLLGKMTALIKGRPADWTQIFMISPYPVLNRHVTASFQLISCAQFIISNYSVTSAHCKELVIKFCSFYFFFAFDACLILMCDTSAIYWLFSVGIKILIIISKKYSKNYYFKRRRNILIFFFILKWESFDRTLIGTLVLL